MSNAPFGIQRSKLTITKLDYAKANKIYNVVFSTLRKPFPRKKTNSWTHLCILKLFNHTFFTNCRGK
jgi:uncharacterized protein (UPF0332 family)